MATNKKNLRLCTIKHESKTYQLFIAVADLDEVNNIIQEWAVEKFGTTIDLPTALTDNNDVLDLTSIPSKIDSYVYMQSPSVDYTDLQRNVGITLPLPTFPTSLTGGLYIAPVATCFLYSAANYSGNLAEYSIPTKSFTPYEGMNYVGIIYNSGVPEWYLTNDESVFNGSSSIMVLKFLNISDTLFLVNTTGTGTGLPEQTFETKKYFEISGNYTLSNTTQFVTLSAMSVKYGLKTFSLSAFDSETDIMYLFYKDGSGDWQKTLITEYIDNQYQSSASGLQSLSPGEFVNNDLYRIVSETQEMVGIVLSGAIASQAIAAESNPVTDLPPELENMGVCVGRFIVEYDNGSLKKQQLSPFNFVTV